MAVPAGEAQAAMLRPLLEARSVAIVGASRRPRPPAPAAAGSSASGQAAVAAAARQPRAAGRERAVPAARRLWDSGGAHPASGRPAGCNTAAERIGWPVVLKTAADVAHKSDAGGVQLGFAGAGMLAAAYADMSRSPGPEVTVSAMVPPGAELALGICARPVVRAAGHGRGRRSAGGAPRRPGLRVAAAG